MDIRPKVRNAVLLSALAAAAATAWATSDSTSYSSYTADTNLIAGQPAAMTDSVVVNDPVVSNPAAPQESLSSTESVVTTTEPKPIPVVDRDVSQPPITVETQRLTDDQRIQ